MEVGHPVRLVNHWWTFKVYPTTWTLSYYSTKCCCKPKLSANKFCFILCPWSKNNEKWHYLKSLGGLSFKFDQPHAGKDVHIILIFETVKGLKLSLKSIHNFETKNYTKLFFLKLSLQSHYTIYVTFSTLSINGNPLFSEGFGFPRSGWSCVSGLPRCYSVEYVG